MVKIGPKNITAKGKFDGTHSTQRIGQRIESASRYHIDKKWPSFALKGQIILFDIVSCYRLVYLLNALNFHNLSLG